MGLGGAGVAAQAGGQIFSAVAASQSAKYNSQIASENAAQDLKYADTAAEIGNIDAAQSEQKTRAELGSIKANQGASGVEIGTGSSANVQASASQVGMLDAMTIRSNAARAAYGYQVGAVNEEAEAKLDKRESRNDLIAGATNAGTTVLGGAAKGVQTGMFSDPWSSYSANKGLAFQGPTPSGETLDTTLQGGI